MAAVPAPATALAPVAASAPAPPPPNFEVARRFSPDIYARLLERLIPVDETLRRAGGAFIATRLAAIEKDLFEDDWYYREGAVVLLGREDGMVVGLTYRYHTDIKYPDIKLIGDGMGQADIADQYLSVLSNRGECGEVPQPSCRQHRLRLVPRTAERRSRDEVQARVFDEHDIALLYFHPQTPLVAERTTLELDAPSAAVEDYIRNAERAFGLEFTLVSKQAFHTMKDHIKVENTGDKLIVSAAIMGMNPIIGMIASRVSLPPAVMDKLAAKAKDFVAAQIVEHGGAAFDRLENSHGDAVVARSDSASGLAASDFRAGAKFAAPAVTPAGSLAVVTPEGPAEIAALGVRSPTSEQVEAISAYLKDTAAVVDLTLVEFGGAKSGRRGMVLIPGEQVNVNYELLRHGYAKLDTSDIEALRSFPELSAAAHEALEAGTGFARDWKQDADYVAEVTRVRKK